MKKNKFVLMLACLLSISFLGYILKSSSDLSNVEAKLLNSPNVSDVTKIIETRSLITKSPLDDSAWTQDKFDDQSWKKIEIPQHENVGDPAFIPGNFIYYRILVPVSAFKKLAHFKSEIAMSIQEVQLKKFDIFINGRLFRSYTPKTIQESLDVIPLDETRDNIICLKGKIEAGDYGIYSRGKIIIGKVGELNELFLASYKAGPVFNLIYLLSKGSILIVFTLLFLVLNVERFFEKSLLFILFVILEDVIVGDYLSGYLTLYQQVGIYNLLNVGINISLFLFLADVLERKYSARKVIFASIALAVVSTFITLDLLKFNLYFNFDLYLRFWNYIFIAVLVFFLPSMVKKEKVLAGIVCISLAFTMWSSIFSSNVGFNYKTFANLLIFFGVAYQTFMLLRREQIQLMEQEKDVAIGKTAAVLAHDVRRPLEQMSLILDKLSSGESSEEFLRIAKQDVEFSLTSVENHINDIVNFTREQPISLGAVSIYNVLANSIKQVMSIKPNLDIKLEYSFKADRKIMGDEGRLAGVMVNLIANATEAISEIGKSNTGTIKFESFLEGSLLVFKISNSGPHIPKEILTEIFKPLFTSGKSSGTGLGLASVLKIVKEHQGEINVHNLDQGGVQFIVRFLASSEMDLSSAFKFLDNSKSYSYDQVNLNELKTIEGLRIFLLDDDTLVYDHLMELVKGLPFNVELFYARSVSQAEAMVKAKRYDLYILDSELGDGTGLEFYQKNLSFLKEEVFLITEKDQGMTPSDSLNLMQKPIAAEKLSEMCRIANSVRRKILLVEDSKIITIGWIMFHGKHNVYTVSNPVDALKFLETKPEIDICVIDYHFDGYEMNGEELGKLIKRHLNKVQIFISTSSNILSNEFRTLKKNDYIVR